jgi:chromosome segregation ATPase
MTKVSNLTAAHETETLQFSTIIAELHSKISSLQEVNSQLQASLNTNNRLLQEFEVKTRQQAQSKENLEATIKELNQSIDHSNNEINAYKQQIFKYEVILHFNDTFNSSAEGTPNTSSCTR